MSYKQRLLTLKGDPMIPPTSLFPGAEVKELFLEEENPMPDMIAKLMESSDYEARKDAIEQFNKVHLNFKPLKESR